MTGLKVNIVNMINESLLLSKIPIAICITNIVTSSAKNPEKDGSIVKSISFFLKNSVGSRIIKTESNINSECHTNSVMP